ncbi:MAG: hypothetical protein Q8P17_04975 [bacterium]|nr:hypothetical protein [bacterium]
MSWAARGRFIILLIVGAVVTAFLTVVFITTFYKTPSCTDGKQNQDEAGIDCGGSCAYLCIAQQVPPTVLFTKTLQNISGRVDIIAEVENKNANAAAKNVPYAIALYDANQVLVKEISGTLDLPPGAVVPVYVSGVTTGEQSVTHAFLTLEPSSIKWYTMNANTRTTPAVSTITQSGSRDAPRIEVVFINSGLTAYDTVEIIAFVRGESGDIIAASKTLVRTIPAQGQATAIFTWNTAFSSATTSVEVVPIIPLL